MRATTTRASVAAMAAMALPGGWLAATAGPASAAPSSTITVSPGQSIQAAVDAASPGATILIAPGTYHEAVQIRKDGLTVQGSPGTVLEPPASSGSLCTMLNQGMSGICILAKSVNPETGQVLIPVRNDTVRGLTVRDFPADGVFGYGTANMVVQGVHAVDNASYGISRFVSTGTNFSGNRASGSGEAGFYVGDSPDASTVVTGNVATGNQFGVFVRHARGVRVQGNSLTGNCVGLLVLDDGQEGGAGNVQVRGNLVRSNNKFCAGTDESPPLSGIGIALVGATDSLVSGNVSIGNNSNEGAVPGGGIVLLSAAEITGGSDLANDVISHNVALANRPNDIFWDGSGSGTVSFPGNVCRTSQPAWICRAGGTGVPAT